MIGIRKLKICDESIDKSLEYIFRASSNPRLFSGDTSLFSVVHDLITSRVILIKHEED